MKHKIIITLALACAILSACNKKDLIVPPVSGTTNSDSYQPMTAGSTWSYTLQSTTNVTDVIKVTMTGKTVADGGRTYYEATSSSAGGGNQIAYFYNVGDLYSFKGSSPQAGISMSMDYLDISKPVNGTWTSSVNESGQINNVPAKFLYKLTEKNVERTVGGRTFKNVMHTVIEMQYNLGNGFQTVTTYDYFVAKGIGMIELDTYLYGALAVKETITTYDIK